MIKYCLSCGYEVEVEPFVDTTVHTKVMSIFPDTFDMTFCEGPFAETPPPDVPIFDYDEPSPEEMGIYNLIGRMMQLELAEA